MPGKNTDDLILDALQNLPRAAPAAHSTERTRSRARAILARQRDDQQRPSNRIGARAVDGGFVLVCVVYLSGAVAQALRLFGGLR